MFSQKRKKYKNMVWASVLVAVAILALVFLLGYLGSFRERPYEEPAVNEAGSSIDKAQTVEPERMEPAESKELTADTELQKEDKKETYYLVKYDNDVICVYFSDQQGELTKLEDTAIVYETLSLEDQGRFQEGIEVGTRDALNRLLMDYES